MLWSLNVFSEMNWEDIKSTNTYLAIWPISSVVKSCLTSVVATSSADQYFLLFDVLIWLPWLIGFIDPANFHIVKLFLKLTDRIIFLLVILSIICFRLWIQHLFELVEWVVALSFICPCYYFNITVRHHLVLICWLFIDVNESCLGIWLNSIHIFLKLVKQTSRWATILLVCHLFLGFETSVRVLLRLV